jgi:hypothetical protein
VFIKYVKVLYIILWATLKRAVLFLLLVCGLSRQEFRAALQGIVTDPTGAVIPMAE